MISQTPHSDSQSAQEACPALPHSPLGMLILSNNRISTPRLAPPAWISACLATLSLPLKLLSLIPPVP